MAWDMRKQWSFVKWMKDTGANKAPNVKVLYDNEVRKLREAVRDRDWWEEPNDSVVVKKYDEGAVIRIPLGIKDKDMKEEAETFAELLWMSATPSQYDCTGQLFTVWQSVHYMNEQWWVWQRNTLDV